MGISSLVSGNLFTESVSHKPNTVREEISHLHLNGSTVHDYEGICNFIPHFLMDVIIYARWGQN